jgi:hypothetical protein
MDSSRWSVTLALAAMLGSTLATAQTRLGDLLDAGARRVTADRFRQEIVQRSVQGPLEPGVNVEIVHTSRGTLEGAGSGGAFSYSAEWAVQVLGTWSVGDDDSICATVTLNGPTIRASYRRRCQFWFSLGERYFVAESTSDRAARVLARTVR